MRRSAIIAALAATATLAAAVGVPAQPGAAPSPLVGRWQIDIARTTLNMNGPDKPFAPRDPTFTWIVAPEGDHLRMRVYTRYPQPAPTRTVAIHGDGKPYACETKNSCWNSAGPETGARETVSYWRISPHMYARIVKDGDQVMECVTMAVSTDGRVLTAISWHPETPHYENIQIFNRVG